MSELPTYDKREAFGPESIKPETIDLNQEIKALRRQNNKIQAKTDKQLDKIRNKIKKMKIQSWRSTIGP